MNAYVDKCHRKRQGKALRDEPEVRTDRRGGSLLRCLP